MIRRTVSHENQPLEQDERRDKGRRDKDNESILIKLESVVWSGSTDNS